MPAPRPEIVFEVRLRLADAGEVTARLIEGWRWVESLPPYDAGRLEFEAQLHLFLARLAWREADRARAREARRRR
jgi:hypothetical protein